MKFNRYQAGVLAERYLDVFLGDPTGLFFLVFQPIAVAICTGLVWQGTQATPTLYFVLVFAAIFFGCVNACREIVKEKAIFQRERLVGLEISAYIASKLGILAMLGLGQTLLFYFGVRYFLVLEGNPILMLGTIYASLLSGTALGLGISALVVSDVMALALVPVALIPQLLFSKIVMPKKSLTGALQWLEQLTLVKWGYQAMEEIVKRSPDWGKIGESIVWLGLIGGVLVLLSALILKLKESL